ncbi:LytR family transcriptional regulator [Ammoniphilus sp. 3BR4]|uniref:LytR family transcriptional regulator n=1 Tax=Ammoniphilus sp. 3BR4 TaxID=3158265 RepID=UPI003465D3A5
MKCFDDYPKALKKTIRYINQDELTIEQLEVMQKMLNYHINKRKKELYMNQDMKKIV